MTRLQGDSFVLNTELLLFIERTPDTTLILVTGQRVMVQETPDEIVKRVVEYRRRVGVPEVLWKQVPTVTSEELAGLGADGNESCEAPADGSEVEG